MITVTKILKGSEFINTNYVNEYLSLELVIKGVKLKIIPNTIILEFARGGVNLRKIIILIAILVVAVSLTLFLLEDNDKTTDSVLVDTAQEKNTDGDKSDKETSKDNEPQKEDEEEKEFNEEEAPTEKIAEIYKFMNAKPGDIINEGNYFVLSIYNITDEDMDVGEALKEHRGYSILEDQPGYKRILILSGKQNYKKSSTVVKAVATNEKKLRIFVNEIAENETKNKDEATYPFTIIDVHGDTPSEIEIVNQLGWNYINLHPYDDSEEGQD